MPIVTIKSPTGREFKIEAPEGATDEQILRFAQSQGLFNDEKTIESNQSELGFENLDVPSGDNLESQSVAGQQPEPTIKEKVLGGAEALASLATGATTGALGFAGGSILGAIGELTGLVDSGQDLATKTASLATFEPRTEFGKELLSDLVEPLSALPPVMGGAPIQSIKAASIPTAKTLKTLGKAKRVGQRVIQDASKTKTALAEEIKAGNRNIGNIAMQLDADGTLIKNPNIKKAIKLMGNDEAAYETAINFEKMDTPTRKQVNKMLDTIVNNKESGDPVQIMNNRPSDIIGQSLADGVNELNNIKKGASKRIGNLINGELGNKKVNINNARNEFLEALKDADISTNTIDRKVVADTSRTLTNIKEVVSNERLNNVLNRLQKGTMTAKEAHKLKRNLREIVSFEPSSIGSVKVSAEIENAFKKLSSGLNESINKVDSRYKKANQIMAESIGGLKEVDKLLGNQLMIGDDLAVSKLGSLSKRIGSNLASREQVISMVDELQSSLNKRGKSIQGDIKRQVAALSSLEKIFKVEGSQSPFGFQARIENVAIDAATGGQVGLTREGLGMAINKFKSMNELEFNEKIKALRALSKVNNNE